MALNNASADSLAAAICSALGIADAASQTITQTTWRLIYARLKTDITITIAALSVGTTGTAAAQSGPQSPIILNPG